MNTAGLAAFCALAALIAGCGSSGEDELSQWMANERAQTKPRVTTTLKLLYRKQLSYIGR